MCKEAKHDDNTMVFIRCNRAPWEDPVLLQHFPVTPSKTLNSEWAVVQDQSSMAIRDGLNSLSDHFLTKSIFTITRPVESSSPAFLEHYQFYLGYLIDSDQESLPETGVLSSNPSSCPLSISHAQKWLINAKGSSQLSTCIRVNGEAPTYICRTPRTPWTFLR